MPVSFTFHPNKKTSLGVWKIDEAVEQLQSLIRLSEEEKMVYNSFLNENRRKHWLAYRALLSDMLGHKFLNIQYDVNGKPYISNSRNHISVSHAGDYAAAIYNPVHPVGIDIEKISPRIEKITCKFLNEEELSCLQGGYELSQLYLYWGAKEALYKLYGKRNLDFRKNIQIEAFQPETEGAFNGSLKLSDTTKKYRFHYKLFSNYCLVYVFGQLKNT
ncbi:MAG: 4'-phosphopantetheinyl transferase superfamily protein [Bacteroidales bacterium]|nr:4'-phosphopantetheinyl transferase superfamily protein [Bacteroidales bacterium]MCF8343140.1 4'-phosphopantetheinyl transferase superfamily protein [Bacteroidales bacterium]MCF8351549.1 4'-phosphopantetheinyl transferase superfamily protein [Bacteroidales bacterium]MCF8376498.1 4'-phosphopantetheinyl transferase superfamily protein [Bacteroidales bacterium]MCF8401500.1 4'-phosphopantetheinyl transferase superfamily protein [Bacteroidales bacterium]